MYKVLQLQIIVMVFNMMVSYFQLSVLGTMHAWGYSRSDLFIFQIRDQVYNNIAVNILVPIQMLSSLLRTRVACNIACT